MFICRYMMSLFVQKKQQMGDIVDAIKLTKLYPWYEILGVRIQV